MTFNKGIYTVSNHEYIHKISQIVLTKNYLVKYFSKILAKFPAFLMLNEPLTTLKLPKVYLFK